MTATLHDTLARWTSRAMQILCLVSAVVIVALLVLIVGYLIHRGAGALWESRSVFFSLDPIASNADPRYPGGMRNAVAGTLMLIGMASIIGVPLGILAGVYLAEYEVGSWLAGPVRFLADVLAGVPSIVVGVLGYELLVVPAGSGVFAGLPLVGGYFEDMRGNNGFAGALALAFIMVPLVARTTEEMLRLVPRSYREASIALGATKARTVLRVVLPSVTGSVVTGIMLAVARIAGETAPLLFTAAGSRFLETDPRRPFPSLTVQIYNYATGPSVAERQMAWAGILVLIGLVFVLNLAIRFATRNSRPAT